MAVLRLLEGRRREVVVMLEACGIPPRDIPLATEIRRRGSRVHVERFVRDEETGNIRLREDGRGAVSEEFSFEPERMPDWIPLD